LPTWIRSILLISFQFKPFRIRKKKKINSFLLDTYTRVHTNTNSSLRPSHRPPATTNSGEHTSRSGKINSFLDFRAGFTKNAMVNSTPCGLFSSSYRGFGVYFHSVGFVDFNGPLIWAALFLFWVWGYVG
jgi:hypothetical protein